MSIGWEVTGEGVATLGDCRLHDRCRLVCLIDGYNFARQARPRLQRLARLYGVPVERLLPSAGPAPTAPSPAPPEPVRVDLARLAALDSPERDVLHRYVTSVQIQRGDFNGRVITIRDEDVRALGRVLLSDEAATRARLREVFVIDPALQ